MSNENSNSYALNKGDHPTSPPPPPPPPAPYIREIPSDLTKEDLIKEAQKVIAQTERIKCTVDTPNSLAGIRTQEGKFQNTIFNQYHKSNIANIMPLRSFI